MECETLLVLLQYLTYSECLSLSYVNKEFNNLFKTLYIKIPVVLEFSIKNTTNKKINMLRRPFYLVGINNKSNFIYESMKKIFFGNNHIYRSIRESIITNNAELIEGILSLDTSFDLKKNSKLLITACQRGNLNIVRMLINFGANINVLGKSGETPIFIAINHGYQNIVEHIVNLKGDLIVNNKHMYNILSKSALMGRYITLNYFFKILEPRILSNMSQQLNIDQENIFHNACKFYDFDKSMNYPNEKLKNIDKIIDLLIDNNVDINAIDLNGNTPLFYILRYKTMAIKSDNYSMNLIDSNQLKLVIKLINNGADPKIVNNLNKNILNVAIEQGHSSELIKFLTNICKG